MTGGVTVKCTYPDHGSDAFDSPPFRSEGDRAMGNEGPGVDSPNGTKRKVLLVVGGDDCMMSGIDLRRRELVAGRRWFLVGHG